MNYRMNIRVCTAAFLLLTAIAVSAQKTVVSAAATIEDRFPKMSGSLRTSTSNMTLGSIKKNTIKRDTLRLYNAGKVTMTYLLQYKESPALSIKPQGKEIQPGKEAYIAIAYDPSKNDEYGFVMERFSLQTNDSLQLYKSFSITAKVEEYFPPMSAEDSALVQKARIPDTRFDYGTVQSGTVVKRDFKIYNDGKRDLLVRALKTGSPAITVTVSSKTIAPGDSAKIMMEFNTTGRGGRDNRSFNLYLNDPAKPETRFELMGTIKKD